MAFRDILVQCQSLHCTTLVHNISVSWSFELMVVYDLNHCPWYMWQKSILWIDILSDSCKSVVQWMWMPQNPVDDMPTLVQVMAWRRQPTSHYLSQCWPRSMLSCNSWAHPRECVRIDKGFLSQGIIVLYNGSHLAHASINLLTSIYGIRAVN